MGVLIERRISQPRTDLAPTCRSVDLQSWYLRVVHCQCDIILGRKLWYYLIDLAEFWPGLE